MKDMKYELSLAYQQLSSRNRKFLLAMVIVFLMILAKISVFGTRLQFESETIALRNVAESSMNKADEQDKMIKILSKIIESNNSEIEELKKNQCKPKTTVLEPRPIILQANGKFKK